MFGLSSDSSQESHQKFVIVEDLEPRVNRGFHKRF